MTHLVVVRPVAEQEMLEAQRWYDAQKRGLGAEFRQSVDLLLQGLGESPLIHPVAYRGVRRAAVRRFPYLVYYSVREDRVEVIGCFHNRRDPQIIRMRVE